MCWHFHTNILQLLFVTQGPLEVSRKGKITRTTVKERAMGLQIIADQSSLMLTH